MDSGCTAHICNNCGPFDTLTNCRITIATAGTPIKVGQKGTVNITFSIYDPELNTITAQKWTFNDVLYIPDCPLNLLSVSKLNKTFYITTKQGFQMRQHATDALAMTAHEQDSLFVVDRNSEQQIVLYTAKLSLTTWHNRLGHISVERLKQLQANKQSTGVDFPDSDIADFTCEVCILGKAHRAPI